MAWIISLSVAPLWSQAPGDVGANSADDRMLTPPPVSGQTYPTAPLSQEKTNYLRGGLSFTSAYSDNLSGWTTNGHPISDVSYSVAPSIAIDETTPRMHAVLSYAPGFTFYQRTSSRDEADQNASMFFQYRLTPHTTFHAQDTFQKSSSIFNQSDILAGAVSGGIQVPNFSIIAPVGDRLSNTGNSGLSYQFSPHGMIGASGTFSNLHFPDPSQVPGLYDSSSQGGSAFYNHRISKMHYLGISYQYQRFASYVPKGNSETQTHAIVLFYTLYPASNVSISLFGGPQHSVTIEPPFQLLPGFFLYFPERRAWTPTAGGSLSWQGHLATVAVSYSHVIASGGGLIGAVHMDSANTSVQRQLTKRLRVSAAGGYAQNDYVGKSPLANNGHTWSGTAMLERGIGEHLNVQLGYTRLHQTYTNIQLLSAFPDANREFVAVSYQFSRPLGR
jgi:hypothetical protein